MTAETIPFFWAPLCILLVGLLLAAYDSSRRANNKTDMIQREAAKLLAQLEKEVADRNHLLNQVRAHYDERVNRKQQNIEKINWSHDEWEKGMDKLLEEWINMPSSIAAQVAYSKITEELKKQSARL